MRNLAWTFAVLLTASGSLHAQIQWGGTDSNQQKGFGRPTQQAPTIPSAPSAAVKPAPVAAVEPNWPQRFELSPGGRGGFGFIVGQPGHIAVSVQSQGVPLIVSLVKPGGATVDRQATGSVSIEYDATADDVRKGVIWGISLRPAQQQNPAGASSNAVHDRPVKLDVKPVASGNVSVRHPAPDMKRAQAEIDARANEANSKRQSASKAAAAVDVATQRQLALNKEQAARHAALLDQVKGKIPSAAHQKMLQQLASRSDKAMAMDSVGAARSGVPMKASPFGAPAARTTSTTSQADTGTGSSGSASTGGASPVGSNQPASVAARPAISSLSVSEGQPGTPVLITGTGFSPTQGEVHFIVAVGKDLTAPVTFWSETQIFAAVPDISGVQGFSGQLYVQRGSDKSALVPFHFVPETETRVLGMTTDRNLKDPFSKVLLSFFVDHDAAGSFLGGKGDDEYFLATRLKNGWVTDSAYLESGTGGLGPFRFHSADAYISEVRPGTDSPYIKVHWWMDAFSDVTYLPKVVIRGPKGVPHE